MAARQTIRTVTVTRRKGLAALNSKPRKTRSDKGGKHKKRR